MENDKFQELVIEQFKEINSTLKDVQAKLKEHDKRFDSHDKRFDSHDSQFAQIQAKLTAHDGQFETLLSQVKENTQILKSLEPVAEVNKSEHDKTDIILAEISGGVKKVAAQVEKLVVNDNEFINWAAKRKRI